MDIRWKSNLKVLKRIFLGSLLRQIVVVSILSLFGITYFISLFEYGEINTLKQSASLVKNNLMNDAAYTSLKIYSATDYLKKLKDNIIPKQTVNLLGNGSVSFLIVDNTTGEKYSNNTKVLEDSIDYEGFIKFNSYSYYKADNKNNFSPLAVRDPGHTAYMATAQDFTEYYWYDKDSFIQSQTAKDSLRPIKSAKRMLYFVIAWLVILVVFIFHNINLYSKEGWDGILRELKKSSLFKLLDKIMGTFSITGVYKKLLIMIASTLIFLFAQFSAVHGDSISLFYCIIYIVIMPMYLINNAKYLNQIILDVEKIASGDFSLTLKEKGDRDLIRLASSINSIKEGFKTSLEESIKNERLKTELVTNVSHDLKTPLTSIVNYVDILKRKDITPEEREDYLNILSAKSNKLKVLIEDLFEVSKLNSGKIEITKEKVDIIDLLYQSLGEYSSYHEEKNIKFKVSSMYDDLYLSLDGKQFSRVFENLISNALKYSLENTRVYIDIEGDGEEITISFKNISAYELDFDVDEIFERFKRGDESRNSEVEGSGLGLAISKTIVDLHGGDMFIEKEGDLFKVFIRLKLNE